MVTITDKAKGKIDHLMQDASLDGSYFLRVSVQGGGCSGLSYNLDFDNEIKKGDQFFEDRGIRLALDMKSFLYLAGTELDFSDGLNGKGFNFHNPNATRVPAVAARVSQFRISLILFFDCTDFTWIGMPIIFISVMGQMKQRRSLVGT